MTSVDLIRAILALDVYNRGIAPRINDLGVNGKLGDYTLLAATPEEQSGWSEAYRVGERVMAFSGSTNNLERPQGLRDILAPRLPQNTNGFQGAYIIGSSFWRLSIPWLGQLGFLDNQNGAFDRKGTH